MSAALPTIDEAKRSILFTPLESKAALHNWIMEFLHLDMPDTIVDPASTSTPMDLIWEVYDAARTNNRPEFARVMGYASRDSFKTLGAAVLEVLAMVHLRRNVAHMAAIESQAKKAQSYVKAFLSKPFLRDYLVGDNDREKHIARYHNPRNGANLTKDQFAALSLPEKLLYEEITNYIKIVICTPKGANSEHVPFFVVDEVDLSNPIAYEEAKMIPAPYGDQMPITLLTSTRKYSFGLVQKELDDAGETGLVDRHWNIIDVTERCPTTRHMPEHPKLKVFYSDHTLETISPERYEELTPEVKVKYEPDEAYAGCVRNCKLFAACRGRLATKQKPANLNAKVRSLLKPVTHTQNVFKAVDVEVAKAQLLCRKPSSEGLVYPNYDHSLHFITAAEMAEKLTGDPYPEDFSKPQLLALMSGREVRYASGMDFGYTHRFAVITGGIDGNRCFVFDVISQAEIELEQQIESCDHKIKDLNPKIAADSANPQAIKTFSKRGYRIRGVEKGKGSVLGGIEVVRMMLRPGLGMPPRLYFLAGDEGCELLGKRLSQYHWTLDGKTGDPTDVPDDKDDDEADALRYLIMANFGKHGRVTAAKETPAELLSMGVTPPKHSHVVQTNASALQQQIRSAMGDAAATDPKSASLKGRKGGFYFDL